ncbi:MAG: glycogen/starch/alpha-glucan family phosphorylase, partial [Synechococcus sp.]|nr:glycogen/starch/alpha-glucan family phosphorylase [Synechococcus sp.]
LEKWGLPLFASLLPRHLELIFEINRRFLQQVRLKHPGNDSILRKLSIIDEEGQKAVRMAHLATVGSHHVNGVAKLHSDLVKSSLMPEFAALWPEKFTNVTNGVTPRRWMGLCNPQLRSLLDDTIGEGWLHNLDALRQLEQFQHDGNFLQRWEQTKLEAKRQLASYIHRHTSVLVDPASLFDVQVKRIHEYKRQHLNALQVIAQYLRIKNGQGEAMAPRTVIFGGKAAPGYYMAKLIIRFINGIAETVNSDPDMDGRLRVVFLPDYNVKLGQRVYPASDLSEQISTAGKEASGTGNMKFALNGALTIGTLDGANVEIREQVGADNFFLFGKTTPEIEALRRSGYRPWELLEQLPELAEVLHLVEQGHFSNGDTELFRPLVDNLRGQDPFFVFADFAAYMDAQDAVSQTWADRQRWNRISLLNTARMGYFSSDRSIREYCDAIWNASAFPVQVTCQTHGSEQASS